jgi:hypothetical protein
MTDGGAIDGGSVKVSLELGDVSKFTAALKKAVDTAAKGVHAEVGIKFGGNARELKKDLRTKLAAVTTGVEARIDVTLNSRGLKGKLRADVLEASRGLTAKAGVEVDSRGLIGKLRAVASAASKTGIDVSVGLNVRAGRMQQKINAAVAGQDLHLPVRLEPTTRLLRSKLKKLARDEDLSLNIGLDPGGRRGGTDRDQAADRRDRVEDTRDLAEAHDKLDESIRRAHLSELDLQDDLRKAAKFRQDERQADADWNRLNELIYRNRKAGIKRTRQLQEQQDLSAHRRAAAAENARRAELTAATRSLRIDEQRRRIRQAADEFDRAAAAQDTDVSATTRAARREADDIGARRDAKIDIELGIKKAKAQIAELIRKKTLEIDIESNIASVQAEIARLTRDRDIELRYDADFAGAHGLLAELTRHRDVRIKYNADIAEARTRLASLEQDLEATVKVDTEDIAAAQGRLKRLEEDLEVTVNARAETTEANIRLGALARDRTSEIKTKVNTRGIDLLSERSSLSEVRILALAGAIASLVPLIAPIGAAAVGAAAGLAAMATAGIAGIGTLVLGFSGVSDVVEALKDVREESTKTSQRAAADADTVANATDGVINATEALKNARRDAADGSVAASRRVADADRAVADALRGVIDAQEGVAAAAQGVIDAEEGIADAQDAARRAQESLTDARRDARRAMQDLQLQIRGAIIDQEQATIAQARARRELDAVLAGTSATDEQRRAAQLAYEEAVLNVDELVVRNQRLAEEKAEADKKGIEGSDQVQNALRGVEAANDGIEAAQRRVADAQKEVAEAHRGVLDAQLRVTDAELGLADARRDQGRQAAQSAAAIASAQRSLAAAQRGMAAAMRRDTDATSGAMDKLRKATENTTVAGLAFAKFVDAELAPKFKELKEAASGFLPGLEEFFRDAEPLFLGFTQFIEETAETLGGIFDGLGETLLNDDWKEIFDYLARTTGPFLEDMVDTIMSIAEAFGSLLVAFEPVSTGFSSGLRDMAEDFADWAASLNDDKGFRKFIDYIRDIGPLVLDFFRSFIDAAWALLKALQPVGDALLVGWTVLFKAIAGADPRIVAGIAIGIVAMTAAMIAFNVVAGITAALMNTAFGGIPLALGLISGALAGFGVTWGVAMVAAWRNSEEFRDKVAEALGSLTRTFGSIIETIGGIFDSFGDENKTFWERMLGFMENWASNVAWVFEQFEKAWFKYVKPILERDWSSFGDEVALWAARVDHASDDVVDALNRVRDAQDTLNKSRQKAKDRLVDLMDAERDLFLDTQDATDALEEARIARDEYEREVSKMSKAERNRPEVRLRRGRLARSVERAARRQTRAGTALEENIVGQREKQVESWFGTEEAQKAVEETEAELQKALARLRGAKAEFKKAGEEAGDSFWDGFTLDSNLNFRWFNEWANSIVEDLKDVFGIASPSTVTAQMGRDLVQGLINGVMSVSLWELTKAVWSGYVQRVKEFFGIESPSTLFAGFGRDIVKGLIDGIIGGTGLTAVGTFLRNAWAEFTTTAASKWGELKATVLKKWDELKTELGPRWTAFKTELARTWNSVTTTAGTKFGELKTSVSKIWGDLFTGLAARTGIGVKDISNAWSAITELFKKPIRDFIEIVINRGIIETFNDTVGKFLGDKGTVGRLGIPPSLQAAAAPKPKSNIGTRIRLARGGPVWGAGTETSDSIPALLSNNEHVLSAREVKGLGGHAMVETIRAAARSGRAMFAAGGGLSGSGPATFPSMVAWLKRHFPAARASTYQPSFGYHRAPPGGYAADIFTPDVLAAGPVARSVFSGIKNTFKPYIQELIYSHMGAGQVWNGQDHRFTGSVVGQHYNHIHWSMLADGFGKAGLGLVPGALAGADAAGIGAAIKTKVLGVVNSLMSSVPGADSGLGQLFRAIPGKLLDLVLDKVVSVTSTVPRAAGDTARNAGRFAGSWLDRIQSWIFDTGGDLQPGTSLVHNATGRPESVFTARMLDSIVSRLDEIAQLLLTQAEAMGPAVAAMAELGTAFSAGPAIRGTATFGTAGLTGFTRGTVPAAAAGFAPAAGSSTVNVYPRAEQSETEIARLVSRELAWMEVVAR